MSQKQPSNVIIATSTPSEYITGLANEFGLPLYINTGESSIAKDWDFALSCAKTPLVTITHQDDIYLPDYTSELINKVNEFDKPLIFFSDYGEIRDGGIVDETRMLSIKKAMLKPFLKHDNATNITVRRRILSLGSPICCPSVTYNLDLLEQPIFNDNFHCSIDWDTWERLSKLPGAFVYSNKILMRHRIHEGSETTKSIGSSVRQNEDREMFERFWPKPIAHMLASLYSLSLRSNEI